MPFIGRLHTTLSYNGTAITNYANQANMQAQLAQIEATHFGSTAKEFITEGADWTLDLAGMWSATFDAIMGPDVVTPGTKRTVVMNMIDGATTVSYTWTSNGEIANFAWTSAPNSLMAWSAQLKLSGAPVRAVSP